jgi:hypothetical protein
MRRMTAAAVTTHTPARQPSTIQPEPDVEPLREVFAAAVLVVVAACRAEEV